MSSSQSRILLRFYETMVHLVLGILTITNLQRKVLKLDYAGTMLRWYARWLDFLLKPSHAGNFASYATLMP